MARVPRTFIDLDCAMLVIPKHVEELVKPAKVLIVDDEFYTRKAIRTLLTLVGIGNVHDAADGESGLEAIAALAPDVVLLDWEMPGIDGAEFTRRVRSPKSFPYPDVPIIMLTAHSERSRVLEAIRLGVHDFLLKPVSSKALFNRIEAVLSRPRPMIRGGNYYGPERRKFSNYMPDADSCDLHTLLRLGVR